MSLQKKPQAASRPYPQPDVGGSASRDHRNGLANQDEIESGLRKHPFYAHDVSSPQDLNRYSRIHIGPEYANVALTVQAQSLDSKRHEPGNLAMRRHKPELQLQSSTASVPHKSSTPAVRRRRPELSLQNSTLSTPYRATPVDFGKTHVTQDNVRAADVPRRRSIRKSAVVGASSTSSLANPPPLRKVGADSQERRNTPAKPALAKLGLMPLSPLNLSFVDKRQNSTPASTSDRHASRDPGSSSRSTPPQSSAERPVSAVGDARPALSYIPMRRRSLVQTPGLATRTPSRYRLPGGRSSFRSSTSLASVLAGAAPTGAEAGKDAGSEGQRKIQRHMSLPDLQMKAEQERSGTPSESDYQQLGGLKLGTLRITNFSSVPRRMRDSNGGKQTQSTTAKLKNGIGARNAGFRLGSQSVPNLSNPTLSTINATKNGTKDHLNGNPSVSFSSKRHRRFSFGDTPGAASSRKRLSILRELIEEPLDDYDFMREVSSSHPEAVKEDSCNQNQNQIAPTEDNAALKHFADEILDTSDESSVNRISDGSEIKPANDVDPYDISRPDSGFISASSSFSSPGSPSQTDSGYSSSTSIQSKPAVVGSGVGDKTALEGLSGRDTNNMSDDKDGTVSHQTEDDSLNGPHRDSVISLSRSSMRLLSSLIRPRHSFAVSGTGDEGSQLDQNGSNSNNDTLQSKDSSVSQDGTVQPRVRSNSGSQLAGKLQRLFAHHKEDDLSTGYGSHDLRAVPTVPVDVEERLSEHNRVFPTSPKKLTKHSNRSTESLKTIVSVDSAIAYSESNYSQDDDDDDDEISHYGHSIRSGTTYKGHKSMNSLDSVKSLNSIASSGTVRSLPSSESAKSDSTITRGDDTKIFHIEALLDGPDPETEDNDTHLQRTTTPVAIPAALPMEEAYQDAFIGEKPVPPPRNPSRQSRKIGNHKAILEATRNVTDKAAPQEAFTTLRTQDSRFMKNERAILPASQTARTHISSGLDVYRARAPVSAPNLANSFYSNSEAAAKSVSRLTVADLTKELPPEPPRDDLLRSSFSKRPWQQKRLAERKWLQNNNEESVRSYEFHHNHVRSQTTTVMGREQTQVVQDHISVFMSQRRHSTLIHRPAFSESLAIASLERPKDEPQPPYRVLHSYNSPAYKNIPIWA
ncbi:hypothetical protein H634G_05368 [Metarhizium anisopliae BRIP 53293]|uniref:Uncharacterized protein n=1 Tax=Metarhizium anisopliae BRIP 53293 TaxID=1291518 RepID=A0A0D9P112_METAN|nr:hypothetical protein H634G_05368 [Metarhizium anisopliae BRIP 53293]KJK94895.1 hypothetical protein H633G_01302 [Metarhizium anisopliae BRIP 53284]